MDTTDQRVRLTTGYLVEDPQNIKATFIRLGRLFNSGSRGVLASRALLRKCQNPGYTFSAEEEIRLSEHNLGRETYIERDMREVVLAALWEIDHEDGKVELRLVSPIDFPWKEL